MAQGDTFLATLEFTTQDVVWGVNLHYRDDVGLPDADAAQDLLAVISTVQATEFAACLAVDVDVESAYVRKVTGGSAMPALFQHDDVQGTRAGNSLPANSAIVFSQQSDDPQLERPGRIFLSGISKTDTFDGNATADWIQTPATNLAAKLEETLAGTAGTWEPVVLRTINGGLPIIPPLAIPIDNINVLSIFRTMRSRTGKRRGTAA